MYHVESSELIYFATQFDEWFLYDGSFYWKVFASRLLEYLKKHYVKRFSDHCNVTHYDDIVKCDGQVSWSSWFNALIY